MRFSRHNVIYRLRHTSFFSNFSFVVVVVVFVVFVKSNRIESEKRMNRMPYPTTPWICRVRSAPVPYKNAVPYTKMRPALWPTPATTIKTKKSFSTPNVFSGEIVLLSERRFSSFSVDFGGARRLLTSKSDSLMIFAPGTQLLRSVRLLELSFVVRSFKKLGKF